MRNKQGMIYDANDFGSSDFAENFSSLRQEKQARDEALELERIAALLERIANEEEAERARLAAERAERAERVRHQLLPRELLRIDSNGDIADDHRRGVDRKKVHTLDDLPKESLYESLFPEQEPDAVKVESGRRLRDGKIFHHAYYDDPVNGKSSLLEWTGLSFDALVLLGAFALFVLMLLVRLLLGWLFAPRRYLPASSYYVPASSHGFTEVDIEHLVQKSLEKRLAIIEATRAKAVPEAVLKEAGA
jgi:hypothetical protein